MPALPLRPFLILTLVGSLLVAGVLAGSRRPDSDALGPTAGNVKAGAENERLSTELDWLFGGRNQKGWTIYVPLMRRLLGTEAAANSPEFSMKLGKWQSRAGLTPTGILDESTLMGMIGYWQRTRPVKNPREAAPETLTVIDETYLYDRTRAPELRFVEKETYAAYLKMYKAALADKSLKLKKTAAGEPASDESFFKIVSAFRSQAYQEQLRKASPGVGSAGLAKVSPHLTGRALDLYVGGDPVSTKDENRMIQIRTPVYLWLVKNAEKYGFYPYFYEPWHWEYRTTGGMPKGSTSDQ